MSNFQGGDANEAVEQAQAAQPTLCSNNCGFFANVGTMGMCSKCFREVQAQQEKAKAAADIVRPKVGPAYSMPATCEAVELAVSPAPAVEIAAIPSTSGAPADASPDVGSKGPSRCQQCRKKVGLTGFKCKCGSTFCGIHRYAEAHSCTFDYKTTERQRLTENNPLVQASKVQRF